MLIPQAMTSNIKLSLYASILALACFPSLRAEYSGGAGALDIKEAQKSAESMGASYKSTDIIGLPVQNDSAAPLGEVADLAVDLPRGKLIHVIVGTGGFLESSEFIAVPPSEVRADFVHKIAFLDLTEGKLKTAPTFDTDRWNDFYESARWRESCRFFETSESLGTEPKYVTRASRIIGIPVKSLQGEKIGIVQNLMVDVLRQKIVAVVISSGGFLGLGQTLSAVPPQLLTFNNEHDELQIDVTKEKLQNVSSFSDGNWPDFTQPLYVESIYRAYHLDVTPMSDLAEANVTIPPATPATADTRP